MSTDGDTGILVQALLPPNANGTKRNISDPEIKVSLKMMPLKTLMIGLVGSLSHRNAITI